MVAGDGNGESAFGEGLAADVVEKRGVFICFGIFYNGLGRVDDGLFALEVEEEFAEIFDADEGDTRDEGSLREIF